MSFRIAPLARSARRQAQINFRAPAIRRHFAEGPKVVSRFMFELRTDD
jgi:hypothetical protein